MENKTNKIIKDNLKLHNAPLYADFYDTHMGFLKHRWERKFILSSIDKVTQRLKRKFPNTKLYALDAGAGTGNITIELLKRDLNVLAIDLSEKMLEKLREKISNFPHFNEKIEIICEPIDSAIEKLNQQGRKFHLITSFSFYHHLPDYFNTFSELSKLILPDGILYLAHEPMKKDTISYLSRFLSWLDFKYWRIKEHIKALILRRPILADLFHEPDSDADYWAKTTGCDQLAMKEILIKNGFDVDLILYDSKRSALLHYLAQLVRTKILFAIIAQKQNSSDPDHPLIRNQSLRNV